MSQEKWFIFIVILFVVPASLSCSLPFVSVETWPDGCLVEGGGVGGWSFCSSCVLSEGSFVVFYLFSFPLGVCVGT